MGDAWLFFAFTSSGCDGVMIGRGGLGNPWIYKSIEAQLQGKPAPELPSLEEKKRTALQHLEYELRFEAEKPAVLRFRKIACWYFHAVPGAAELRNKVNSIESAQGMRDAIQSFGA